MRGRSLSASRRLGRRRLATTVVLVIGVAGLGACTEAAEPAPTPTTTHVEPTPTGPTIDPDKPSTEFVLPSNTEVTANGVLITVGYCLNFSTPDLQVSISGEGFGPMSLRLVDQVAEIPGWGLLTVERLEGDPPGAGGGRPSTILHFRAQTDTPLEFTSAFTLENEYGWLDLTDLRGEVQEDGTATDGIAVFTIRPETARELHVEGPAGTVVEVPDWGTITIIEHEADETDEAGGNGRAPLWIQTVTDFPVVDESPF